MNDIPTLPMDDLNLGRIHKIHNTIQVDSLKNGQNTRRYALMGDKKQTNTYENVVKK